MLTLSAAVFTSFAATLLVTPILTRKLMGMGMVGVDLHKPGQPLRTEMGGIAVALGFATGVLTISIISTGLIAPIWPGFLTILLVALVGALDDFVGLRQRYKPFLVAFCTLPLILTYEGSGAIWFPLVGALDFELLYPFVIIPLAVATSANFTNMLAGFNGLEAGIGAITLTSLGLLSLILGNVSVSILAFAFGFALAAFLRYNWFPAKVFPGDAGTLTIGACIAVVAILGGIEFAAMWVSIPAAFDFTLKLLSKHPFAQRGLHGDARLSPEGFLEPPPYPALAHALLRVHPLTERGLVATLLVMEVAYAASAVVLTLLLR